MPHHPRDPWEDKATNILKAELVRKGIGYPELLAKLEEMGVKDSHVGIRSRLSRGKFTFAFFLQCMAAVETEHLYIPLEKRPKATKSTGKTPMYARQRSTA
jgi:hypothetical protein